MMMIRTVLATSAALLATAASLTVAVAPAGADPGPFCGTSSYGASVSVGSPNTSCPFAMNTAEAYHDHGVGSQPFSVTSPVTGLTYTMTCTDAGSVCQGADGAVVIIR